VTARHVNPEGRQPGGDRPFIGASRAASPGHEQKIMIDRFLRVRDAPRDRRVAIAAA
jgi:hypothetical protein